MDLTILKQIPLIGICNYLGLTYQKHGYGGNYKVDHFGGLIIKDTYFYQHSTGEKGGPIDFVMLVEGCSFKEAINLLSNMQNSIEFKDNIEPQKSIDIHAPFEEPMWVEDNKIIYYLLSRKIDIKIINREIAADRIKAVKITSRAKTFEYLNVAFLCRDIKDPSIIKGAIIRGIGQNNTFKGLLENSNGDFGYFIPSGPKECRTLYIFEAPIDALSYITMYGYDPQSSYIAMGGLKLSVIKNITNIYPIQILVCCTDNDIPGNRFNDQLIEAYSSLTVRRKTPILKDWNEDLQSKYL